MRGEGGPVGTGLERRERLPRSPSDPQPLTSTREREARGCPQPSAPSGHAPGSTAPGGRPARPGARGAGSCSCRTGPGLLHPSCLGQIRGFRHPHFPVQGSSCHADLGPLPGQDCAPLPFLRRVPPFQMETEYLSAKGCLLSRGGGRVSAMAAVCGPRTTGVGGKVPGKSQVLEAGGFLHWALGKA